jgi:hypothetical protein
MARARGHLQHQHNQDGRVKNKKKKTLVVVVVVVTTDEV